MPIKAVKKDVAAAINNLTDLLKRDYGCDFSYSINGNGFTLAQHNINGIHHPVPLVESPGTSSFDRDAYRPTHERRPDMMRQKGDLH